MGRRRGWAGHRKGSLMPLLPTVGLSCQRHLVLMGWRAHSLSGFVYGWVLFPVICNSQSHILTQRSVLSHMVLQMSATSVPVGAVRTLASRGNLAAHLPSNEQQSQRPVVFTAPVPCPWGLGLLRSQTTGERGWSTQTAT